jgi:hypothetical protein
MPGSSDDHLRVRWHSDDFDFRQGVIEVGSQEGLSGRRDSGVTRSPADARLHPRADPPRGDAEHQHGGRGGAPCQQPSTCTPPTAAGTAGYGASLGAEAQPCFLRPPTWLYLPAQGIFGGDQYAISQLDLSARVEAAPVPWTGRVEEGHRGRASLQRGEPPRAGSAGGAIRGRGPPPGSGIADAGRSRTPRRSSPPSIRGQHAMPGARRADAGGLAQRRLEAGHAHIAISLLDHAERVAAKRERQGARAQEPTAAQRLKALRRRVEARVGVAGLHASQADELGPSRVGHQATATAGQAPETGGNGQITPSVGTNEVLNMHYRCGVDDADDFTAVAVGSGGGDSSHVVIAAGATRCEGGEPRRTALPPPAAEEAAARATAWHAVGGLSTLGGPSGEV